MNKPLLVAVVCRAMERTGWPIPRIFSEEEMLVFCDWLEERETLGGPKADVLRKYINEGD